MKSIVADMGASTLTIPEVACELLLLIRDEVGWSEVRDFVRMLPQSVRHLGMVKEQELLALAETGHPLDAIVHLEMLIARNGDSPEREGIIGGRYKRLWREAQKERTDRREKAASRDEQRYLDKAIDHYTRGMELDYNLYYCSCNLPQLLRARRQNGDLARALIIDNFVIAACTRALKRSEEDEWLRPTLLGAAFRAPDLKKAAELANQVEREGAAAWKLDTTLADLKLAVEGRGAGYTE